CNNHPNHQEQQKQYERSLRVHNSKRFRSVPPSVWHGQVPLPVVFLLSSNAAKLTSQHPVAQHPFPTLYHPFPHTIARSTTSTPSLPRQVPAPPDSDANIPPPSRQPLVRTHSDRTPRPVARSDTHASH